MNQFWPEVSTFTGSVNIKIENSVNIKILTVLKQLK